MKVPRSLSTSAGADNAVLARRHKGWLPDSAAPVKERMMNSLSWMIYLAGMTGSLSGLLAAIACFGCVGGLLSLVLGETAFRAPPSIYSWDNKADKTAAHEKIGDSLRRNGRLGLKVGIPAAILACLLPSQSTVYAIAASEMGERAMNSQLGGKALKALDAWLDRQIAPKPSGDDKK